MTHALPSTVALAGRVLLCLIFLNSAAGKITNWQGTLGYMESRGMPLVQVALPAAVLLEGLGGVSLLLGFRARFGAVLLIVFLVPATLYFHNFWTCPEDQARMQMIHFMKNLAIMGGLLTIAAHGPGGFSLDARRTRAGMPSHERPRTHSGE